MIYYCSLNMILLNDKFIWIYFLFYILYSTFSTVILTYNVGMLLQSNIDTSITGFFQIEPSRFNIHNFNTAHATFHYNSHNVIWITEAVNNTSSEYPLKYFIIADMLFFHFHFLAEYVNSIWLWKPYITVHIVGSHWLSLPLSLSFSHPIFGMSDVKFANTTSEYLSILKRQLLKISRLVSQRKSVCTILFIRPSLSI